MSDPEYSITPYHLNTLSPDGVVSLHGRIEQEWLDERNGIEKVVGSENLIDDRYNTPLNQEFNRLVVYLSELPASDVERALQVYTGMVESELVGNRSMAAVLLSNLTLVDAKRSLPLWERLLDPELEPDAGVRDSAYSEIMHTVYADDSLTWQQAQRLLSRYGLFRK